ncbi:MAG: oligosaccharide flippase family protein [Cyclobacteriaceae bacterium]|nr:oligosaccharide flippase family protein [Cyclobacteriaceae bacterium]
MGIIKKQALQSSVLLYIGTLIGFLTTGLLAPNLLSESEIGTLRLLMSYSAIFMSISILGISTVTIRFIPQFYNKKNNRHNGFLGIALLVGTLGLLVSIVLILAIKPTIVSNNLDKSPQFARYFYLILPLTLFQTYYSILDSYNNALYRASYGVFLRDFVQRIFILAALTLVLVHLIDFEIYVYVYVAAICFPTLLIFLHLIRHNAIDIRINTAMLNKPLISSMVSVSIFGLLNSFSNLAVLQIDTIMVNMYLDAAAVGIYTITFFFGTLVFIPAKALNKIAPTLIAKAYKEKDAEAIRDIYYKSCGNLYLVGTLILLGLLVNLDNVFHIIPDTYEPGRYVIVLIGIANLIKMAGGTNDSIITYSKDYKITTLFLILLGILVISLNFVFIPLWGMTGAAFASLLSLLFYNLGKMIFIWQRFGLNPYNLQYLVVLVIATGIYIGVSLLPIDMHFIAEIMLDSMLTTLLFYLAIRRMPLAADLDLAIKQVYAKVMGILR